MPQLRAISAAAGVLIPKACVELEPTAIGRRNVPRSGGSAADTAKAIAIHARFGGS